MLFRVAFLLSFCYFSNACAKENPIADYAPQETINLSQIHEPSPEPVTITKAGNRTPYEVNGVTYNVLPSAENFHETGTASWYGMKFHGRPTSNGETFDVFQLTAAHKTLPIPCFARITNLENERSIIVRINDRGPFVEGRVLDLSWAAAAKLGFVEQGLAEVEIEVVSPTETPEAANAN